MDVRYRNEHYVEKTPFITAKNLEDIVEKEMKSNEDVIYDIIHIDGLNDVEPNIDLQIVINESCVCIMNINEIICKFSYAPSTSFIKDQNNETSFSIITKDNIYKFETKDSTDTHVILIFCKIYNTRSTLEYIKKYIPASPVFPMGYLTAISLIGDVLNSEPVVPVAVNSSLDGIINHPALITSV